jgi:REP element-mobilizing transposase RayT
MATLFQNKYRNESTRLQHWHYGWDGAYFITICTKNREYFFGNISDGKIELSGIGLIAHDYWFEISNHANNVELGAFVVMPNHIHGIVILQGNNSDPVIPAFPVGTTHALSLREMETETETKTIGQQRFQNQGKNTISSIIGGYKSAVSKQARQAGFYFAWQSRFYDHIIRDHQSFQNITQYIINNPLNWKGDRFHDNPG